MRNRIGIAVWGAGFAGDFHVKGWQSVKFKGYDVTDAGVSYLSPDQEYAQGQLAEFQNFAECIAARNEGRAIQPKMDIDIATDLVNVIYTGYISAFEEGGREMPIK